MTRIGREKKTIDKMVRIYCNDRHHSTDAICENCQVLLDYAHRRLDNCPFEEQKPACNHCTVHCYSSNRKLQVRQVMRYAGPRMIYKHPLLALQHVLDKFREAPKI